jgi:hypothetical protein
MKRQLFISILIISLTLVLGGCGKSEGSHMITNPISGRTMVGTKEEIKKEEAKIVEQMKDNSEVQNAKYNQKAIKEYTYKIMEVSMTTHYINAIYTDEYGIITNKVLDNVYSIGNPQEVKGNYLVIKYFDDENKDKAMFVVDKSLIDPSKITSKDTKLGK